MSDSVLVFLGDHWGRLALGSHSSTTAKTFTFPDGTNHVKVEPFPHLYTPIEVTIVARPRTTDEIVDILLLNDALREMGVRRLRLVMPYFLGSRQDRVCVEGEPHSSRVFAAMINSCGFEKVHIWDAHSEVSTSLLKNCVNNPGIGHTVARHLKVQFGKNLTLVAPDAGASKKVWDIARRQQIPMIQCDKHRDLHTGEILKFKVNARSDEIEGRDLLLIDDCCTNGGTFLGLRESLSNFDPKSISLAVTHFDHTSGLLSMSDAFDQVFSSDSRQNYSGLPDNVSVIGIIKV